MSQQLEALFVMIIVAVIMLLISALFWLAAPSGEPQSQEEDFDDEWQSRLPEYQRRGPF